MSKEFKKNTMSKFIMRCYSCQSSIRKRDHRFGRKYSCPKCKRLNTLEEKISHKEGEYYGK